MDTTYTAGAGGGRKGNAPVLLSVAEDGKSGIEVSLDGETVWLRAYPNRACRAVNSRISSENP